MQPLFPLFLSRLMLWRLRILGLSVWWEGSIKLFLRFLLIGSNQCWGKLFELSECFCWWKANLGFGSYSQ